MFDNNTMTDDVFTNTNLVFAYPGSREKFKKYVPLARKIQGPLFLGYRHFNDTVKALLATTLISDQLQLTL